MEQSKKHKKLLFCAGGTGGHINPAIAVADEIKKQWPKTEIHFVGAQGKMEMEKVPAQGYSISGLPVMGFQRRLTLKNLSFPIKLLKSMIAARRIVSTFEPDAAVGFGGYASGPILRVAQAKNIPTYIQEQNAFPGVTNKLLGKKAKKIFTAYENMESFFPKEHITVSGNPVRKVFFQKAPEKSILTKKYGFDSNLPVVFFMGGSQGARSINHALRDNIEFLKATNAQIIWQTGKFFIDEAKKLIEENNLSEKLKPFVFIDDIHHTIALADIVVSRAGALAIAELSAIGKACIFIPLPSAAEDHQRKNALALVEKDAAEMIEDKDLKKLLPEKLKQLLSDHPRCKLMAEKIKAFAHPEATQLIANHIMHDLKK